MGNRFCGARGSLCGALASGGSSRAVRSASAVACAAGRSAEHSSRTTPAQGAPWAPGSWRYQELRRHEVPIMNTGLRCPARSAPITAAGPAGRYAAWWLLM